VENELRNIPGYDLDYFVDKCGNIYSKKSGELKRLSVNDDHRGYLICGIKRNDGKSYPLKVHHAVLYAFVGPKPEPHYLGMHIDDDSYNNNLENLKWGTTKENQESKLKNKAKGKQHKKKLDIEKKELVKRIISAGFSEKDICLLTGWPLKKVQKALGAKS